MFASVFSPIVECMTTDTSTAVLQRNPTGGIRVNLAGITLTVDGAQRAEPWNQTLLWVAQELRQLVQRETGSKTETEARSGTSTAVGAECLTAAERAVVHLVAQGLTNKQVAGQLYVSHRTVDSHVSHALAKLGLTSRVQLARLVATADGWPV
jgi:DNA-binding NarL/FixJ family response regulator